MKPPRGPGRTKNVKKKTPDYVPEKVHCPVPGCDRQYLNITSLERHMRNKKHHDLTEEEIASYSKSSQDDSGISEKLEQHPLPKSI